MSRIPAKYLRWTQSASKMPFGCDLLPFHPWIPGFTFPRVVVQFRHDRSKPDQFD